MKNLIFKYLGVLLMLLAGGTAHAQLEKNIIYLFDCTNSMQRYGIWESAKSALDGTIGTESKLESSQFAIIPFGDDPYEIITFNSKGYKSKKGDIDKKFEKYIAKSKYTHITDVLNAGFKQVDPRKENKIYLLTDGMPNQGDTPEKVAQAINRWCSNHRNTRLFYVALMPGAVNSVIKRAIDQCDDAFIVELEGGIIPQFTDISSHLYTSTGDLGKQLSIEFSLPGDYPIEVSTNDKLFDVKAVKGKAHDGKIALKVSARNGLTMEKLHSKLQGRDHDFRATVKCKDSRFYIANPNLKVHVADGVQSRFSLAGGYAQVENDGLKWYDKYLWAGPAPDRRIGWDLEPVFEHATSKSAVTYKVVPGDGQPRDFTVWFNDKEIAPGETFVVSNGEPAILKLFFEHNALTGKRYINLVPVKTRGIDIINDKPADEYEGTVIRTSYKIGWHPLKIFLFWLAILLLGALVLWLAVLKRFFYPVIKVGRVEMSGPGSYYQSKKLKGARKVVLTSRRCSQGFLSHLMTGEIRYVRADHFSPEIEILPSGAKKKVKLRSMAPGADAGWDMVPSSIFSPYEKGTLINRVTKQKTELEFS